MTYWQLAEEEREVAQRANFWSQLHHLKGAPGPVLSPFSHLPHILLLSPKHFLVTVEKELTNENSHMLIAVRRQSFFCGSTCIC